MGTIWSDVTITSETPKYLQVMDAIRSQISSKILKENDKLPPVRELSYQLNVTPGTIARSYKELISEGLLVAGVGRGTFVKEKTATPIRHNVPIQFSLRYPRLSDLGSLDLIREAMNTVQSSPNFDRVMLNIGVSYDKALERTFLDSLEAEIQLGSVDVQDTEITAGAQHGVSVALQTILRTSAASVAVDDLAYGGFSDVAEVNRCSIHSVAWDEEGPLPWSLEHLHQLHGVSVYMTTSEVNNPTLVKVSNRRRVEIADVAKRCGIQIIEDDCYRFANATGPSYRVLAPENAWFVTSLSKVFSTSLRLGFVIAPTQFRSQMRRVLSSSLMRVSDYLYCVGLEILKSPKFKSIKQQSMADIDLYIGETINRLGRFDLSWQAHAPMVWLWLPKGWRTTAFCQAAERSGVLVVPSDMFALRHSIAPPAVRLCMNAEYGIEPYIKAIDTLVHLLDNPSQDGIV